MVKNPRLNPKEEEDFAFDFLVVVDDEGGRILSLRDEDIMR